MFLTAAATALLLATTAAPNLLTDDPPVPAARPCVATPPNADDECRTCMEDACTQYINDYVDCQGDQACIGLVRVLYELTILSCTTCHEKDSAWRSVLTVVPPSQLAWWAETIRSFSER